MSRCALYARYSVGQSARGVDRGPDRGLPALRRAAGLERRRGLHRPGAERRQPVSPGVPADAGRCRAAPVRRDRDRSPRPAEPQARGRRRPARSAEFSADRAAHGGDRRDHAHACRHARHHGADVPRRPGREDPARTARPGAQREDPGRQGIWLRRAACRPGWRRRAADQSRRGGGGPAHLRAVRGRHRSACDREAAECRGRAGAGWPGLAGHHDSRPARPRHRPPQQRALCRAPGVEPLLVCQGPAHRQAGGAAEPARAMGGRARTRAAHRRRRTVERGQGPPGGGSAGHEPRCRRQRAERRAPSKIPAERPARVWRMRRGLHHRQRA